MHSVGCKRTNAVRRRERGQIPDWIGARLTCPFLPFFVVWVFGDSEMISFTNQSIRQMYRVDVRTAYPRNGAVDALIIQHHSIKILSPWRVKDPGSPKFIRTLKGDPHSRDVGIFASNTEVSHIFLFSHGFGQFVLTARRDSLKLFYIFWA